MTISISTLIGFQNYEQYYSRGLELAKAVGLPVTSWRAFDPTRSFYSFIAEILSALDAPASEFVRSGFLSLAQGDWLLVVAEELYGLDPDDFAATYATPTVTLANTGGGEYTIEAGQLTVKNSATGKTYHSTDDGGGALVPGSSRTYQLTADEAGSDSSVAANELDEMVTTFEGVDITSSTAGLATDKATEDEVREACRDTLGALSPNGPADAYARVAKDSALTSVSGINRASAVGSTTGAVTVTVASQGGAVSAPNLALINAALQRWATPLCSSVTTVSATELTVNGAYTIYKSPALTTPSAEVESAILDAIDALFADTRIGGDGGLVAESLIAQAIHAVFPGLIYRVTGVEDVTLTASQVPARGTITVAQQ
jgi:hypothetical protein